MIKKTISSFFIIFISILISIQSVLALTASELDDVQKEIEQLVVELVDADTELETLEKRVAELEEDITITQNQLVIYEKQYDDRLVHARRRLLDLQLNNEFNDILSLLLTSSNIVEAVQRLSLIIELHQFANRYVEEAEKLLNDMRILENKQVEDLDELVSKTDSLKAVREEKIVKKSILDETIAMNRVALDLLAERQLQSQENTFSRLEEKLNKVDTTLKFEKKESSKNSGQPNKTETSKVTITTTTTQTAKTTTGGRQIVVNASAYSYTESGLKPNTRTGLDLRINPFVIAVDPKVIPLGSRVHIPGYGVYLAADTGSAIKGNKIDIHMKTVAECLEFGRRNITITILD